MIHLTAITPGLVFRDPASPARRNVWRFARRLEGGDWQAELLTGSRTAPTRTVRPADLEHLEAMPSGPTADVDLSYVLGKRVEVETKFGKWSGLVLDIVDHEVVLEGKLYRFVLSLNLGGDVVEFKDVKCLRVLA